MAAIACVYSDLEAPPASQLFEDRNGRFIAQFESPRHAAGFGFWPLAQLPQRVVAATLALEDRRFRYHPGVDVLAVARALYQNTFSQRRVSGASTIAMQVARMQLSREFGDRSRSYARKILEMAVALVMTARHGREALLAQYLRLVPYANRIHGIAYAARIYLAKPVRDLSWAEIAFLTAIPQAPGFSNPLRASGRERARVRAARILNALASSGLLAANELELAHGQLRELRVQARAQRPYAAMHAVMALPRYAQALGDSVRAAKPIRTTLDLDLQGRVHDLTGARLETWREAGAGNAAVMVVDLHDASLLALVGSAAYDDATYSGSINYAKVQRSPGSTLKPFIYALALERGHIAPDSIVDDLPGNAGIANADRRFLGPMLPRQALANSRNLPATRILNDLGVEQTYWALQPLGIHAGDGGAQHYGLGMALGAMPATLERMMSAYAALASDGMWRQLRLFPDAQKRRSVRALSVRSARLVTQFLSDPQARLPTFKRMGATQYPMPVALKTGTSQGYRDAWTFAWTPRYLVGVWVGRADAAPMLRLGGADTAAWLARDVLLQVAGARELRDQALEFKSPPGHTLSTLCAYTGTAAGPGCAREALEWLANKPRPARFRRLAVDTRTEQRATAATPSDFIKVRDFPEIPPRFHAWAAAQRGLLPMIASSGARAATLPAPGDAGAGPDSQTPIRLAISAPRNGLRVLLLPDVPAHLQTLALRAVASGSSAPLVWYVDGLPFKTTRSGASVRWPLATGRHIFQLRSGATTARSNSVMVQVE